jgi:hypothetical protein
MWGRRDRTQHFLLTNFNVHWEDYSVDRAGVPVRTQGWLDHRFRLFETFCLPSVAGQTRLDFVWLVHYAESTPPEYVARLERCRDLVDLRLVTERTGWREATAAALEPGVDRVLTTRLDNDDALQRGAMAALRRAATSRGPEFLNLPRGYSVSLQTGEVRLFEELSNPFLSLVEPAVDELLTVTCTSHRRAAEVAPVRQVRRRRPSWLRVVHERNLENVAEGRPVANAALERDFNVRPRSEWAGAAGGLEPAG